jgi:DNA uptake protein ComE-like DNA-binding protein
MEKYQQIMGITYRKASLMLAGALLTLSLAACGGQSTAATAPAPAIAPIATNTTQTVQPATASAQPSAAAAQPTSAPAQPTAAAQSSATRAATTQTGAATATTATAKLNLNTATAADFLKVPNVGNNMVREFMEYRPYTTILQFRREIGKYVDAQTVAAYEKYVYVPVNVNGADADTLMQLPGVDKTVSAQLMAGRPYASNDLFLQSLGKLVGADNVAAAKAYLVSQ